MGATLSTDTATAAEARRLVCALSPPPSSSPVRGGWVQRLAAPIARAAAWAVLVAQYLLAYGSIGHILHVLATHPADASGALLLLAPLVILLTWALRAAVVLAAGRSPAEWEARWVAPSEAAGVVVAAAATAIDPPPPAAVVLKVAVERERQPDDASPVSIWCSPLPTVRMGGGGLAAGWPPELPRLAAAAVTPGRPPSAGAAAASRPPRPPPRAPRSATSPLLPTAGPPRMVAYGATALSLGAPAVPRLDGPPSSQIPAPSPTAPAAASAMTALRRWVRRSRGGAVPLTPPVPIRLVLRHRLRWADVPAAAAATTAVTAGLAASDGWAGQHGSRRRYRAASLGVDPPLPDDEYLLVEPAGAAGGHLRVARWALGPAAYLAAEATLVPWAYWLAAELLSCRVEVVVNHLLVRGAPGGGVDDGRVGALGAGAAEGATHA